MGWDPLCCSTGFSLQHAVNSRAQQETVHCRHVSSEDAVVVSHMLDEVVTAAMERCVEPTLLDPALLDRLASATPVHVLGSHSSGHA